MRGTMSALVPTLLHVHADVHKLWNCRRIRPCRCSPTRVDFSPWKEGARWAIGWSRVRVKSGICGNRDGWRYTERERGLGKGGRYIIASGLMRRHNCTINDDRFIRRPDSRRELRRSHGTQRIPLCRDRILLWGEQGLLAGRVYRGMSSWSEMTITEGALKLYRTFSSSINESVKSTRNAMSLLTTSVLGTDFHAIEIQIMSKECIEKI